MHTTVSGYTYYVKWNPVFLVLGNFKIVVSPLKRLIGTYERYLFSNYQFVFYHKESVLMVLIFKAV